MLQVKKFCTARHFTLFCNFTKFQSSSARFKDESISPEIKLLSDAVLSKSPNALNNLPFTINQYMLSKVSLISNDSSDYFEWSILWFSSCSSISYTTLIKTLAINFMTRVFSIKLPIQPWRNLTDENVILLSSTALDIQSVFMRVWL